MLTCWSFVLRYIYLDIKRLLILFFYTYQDRSVVISTYALCGFSNISSIGIMLGALGAMAPRRQTALAQVVVRAMIAGNVACFMTACIAGLLYESKQRLPKGCTMHACRDCQRLHKHVPLMLIETFWAFPEELKKTHHTYLFIRNEVTFQRFKYRQDIIDCHLCGVTKGILLNLRKLSSNSNIEYNYLQAYKLSQDDVMD